jgi:hypothetical protein
MNDAMISLIKKTNQLLLNHIRKINKGLWSDEKAMSLYTEDLDHWHGYKIYTPAEFDRYIDETDTYNVVANATSKGFARTLDYEGMTADELAVTRYRFDEPETTIKEWNESEKLSRL